MSSRPSHSPQSASPHPTELINAFREINRDLKTQGLPLRFLSTEQDWELRAGDDLWRLKQSKIDALVASYMTALQSQQVAWSTKVEELEKQVEELRIQQLAGKSYAKNQRRAIDSRYHNALKAQDNLAPNALKQDIQRVESELATATSELQKMTRDLDEREVITRQIDQLRAEMETISPDIIPDDVLATRMQAYRDNMTFVLGKLSLSSAPVSTPIQKTVVGVKNKTHILVKRVALAGAVLAVGSGIYLANSSAKKKEGRIVPQESHSISDSIDDTITEKFYAFIERRIDSDPGLSLDALNSQILSMLPVQDENYIIQSCILEVASSIIGADQIDLHLVLEYSLSSKKSGKISYKKGQIQIPKSLNRMETPTHLPADIGRDVVKFHEFKKAFLERAQKQFPKGNIFNLEILDMTVISQQNNWEAMTAELRLVLITNRGQVEIKRTAKLLPEQNRF